MRLSNRLRAIKDWVEEGMVVADIGTDHALLPVALIRSGLCSRVIASDISTGPLSRARQTIGRSNIQGVELRAGDGLDVLAPYEADLIVIAGLGGETIAQILSRAAWLTAAKTRLLLSPTRSDSDLRQWLNEHGFAILREKAVAEKGRLYAILDVQYTACPPDPSVSFRYIGKLADSPDPAARAYIQRKLRILQREAAAIASVARKQTDYRTLMAAIDALAAHL